MPFEERRKYPRIAESILCRLDGSPAKTKNISCGGALCEFPQQVALMTKLEIVLELPEVASPPSQFVRCEGVVIRQDPTKDGQGILCYVTAIFFTRISQEDRKRIAEFVLQSMLSDDRRHS